MFSEGHNNGIVEGIYRIDRVENIVDILQGIFGRPTTSGCPCLDSVYSDWYNLQEGRISTIFPTRYIRYNLHRYHYYVHENSAKCTKFLVSHPFNSNRQKNRQLMKSEHLYKYSEFIDGLGLDH